MYLPYVMTRCAGTGQPGQQPSETDLQALLRQAASNPGLLQGAPLEQLLQNAASNSVLQTRQLTGNNCSCVG